MTKDPASKLKVLDEWERRIANNETVGDMFWTEDSFRIELNSPLHQPAALSKKYQTKAKNHILKVINYAQATLRQATD